MKVYCDLLSDILYNGERHEDRTGVGTLSLFGPQIVHHMKDGFPLLTTKKLPFRWIAEELIWFLSGSTNEADLRAVNVDIWAEWSDADHCNEFGREPGQMGAIYGGLWRKFPVGYSPDDPRPYVEGCPATVDQFAQLYHDLEHSPNSRRLIVTGWHPYYQKRVSLPPCHTVHQYKVHEDNSLSLKLYARSIDSFLGLPFNIASYGLLLSLVAHTTGRTPRDLIITFGDVHIYSNHTGQVREQISREPKPLPILVMEPWIERSGFGGLLKISSKDLRIVNYNPHPKIVADVAV